MKTKGFIKSKRFWGILIALAGKIIPAIAPQYADVASHVTEAGGLLFGYGTLVADTKIGFSTSK